MKTLLTILICALFLTSCTRYVQTGQSGCYVPKVKYQYQPPKYVVRIR
jgi:hypothetical protein